MKVICLLPTDGILKGQTVEMTEAEYIAQNANEELPRFAPATADVENATPETVVAEESGEATEEIATETETVEEETEVEQAEEETTPAIEEEA